MLHHKSDDVHGLHGSRVCYCSSTALCNCLSAMLRNEGPPSAASASCAPDSGLPAAQVSQSARRAEPCQQTFHNPTPYIYQIKSTSLSTGNVAELWRTQNVDWPLGRCRITPARRQRPAARRAQAARSSCGSCSLGSRSAAARPAESSFELPCVSIRHLTGRHDETAAKP